MTPSAQRPPPPASGKFTPKDAKGLKEWESYLQISPSNAWKSGIPSVQKLLRHLRRYTKSESSREKYLTTLVNFSIFTQLHPEDLVALSTEEIEDHIRDYLDSKDKKKTSKNYLNSLLRRLQTYFRQNGHQDLKIESYFVPSRYRTRTEYIPTKDEVYRIADATRNLRDRALVLTLWSSGARVSTILALSYEDIANEATGRQECIKIPIYPEMKERNPDACKGGIPYYTFINTTASTALRAYIKDRRHRIGKISLHEPLFCSEWSLYVRKDRVLKYPTLQRVNKMLKRAAKNADIEQWNHISAHCLRKAFESVLRSPTIDGSRMDISTQQFLFGHILPGTQDTYYDKTQVEFHRDEYKKLDFAPTVEERGISDIMLTTLSATGLGDAATIVEEYTQAKYGKTVLWRRFKQEDQAVLIQEAMEWKRAQGPMEVETKEKVVDQEELAGYLQRRWTFVTKLDSGECVVRRRK